MEDRENYQIKGLIKSVREEKDKSKLIEIIRKNMSILASNPQLAKSLVNANKLIEPIFEECGISIYTKYTEYEIVNWIIVNGMKSAIEKFGYENIPMKAIYSEEENEYVDCIEEMLNVASEYLDQGKYDSAKQIYQKIATRKDRIGRFQERHGGVSQEDLKKSTIYRAKYGLKEIELRRKVNEGKELSTEERENAAQDIIKKYIEFGLEMKAISIEEIESQLVVYDHDSSPNLTPNPNPIPNPNPNPRKRQNYVDELRPRNRFATFKENFTIQETFAKPDLTDKILFILGGEDEGVSIIETYYTKKDGNIEETENAATFVLATDDLQYLTNIDEIRTGKKLNQDEIIKEISRMPKTALMEKLQQVRQSNDRIKRVYHRGRNGAGQDIGSGNYFARLRKRIDEIKEYNAEEQKKSTQEQIEEPLDSQTENQEESLTEKEKIEQIPEEQETVTRNEEIEESLDEYQEEKSSTKEEHFEESFDRVLEQMKTCDMEYKRLIKIEQETTKRIEEISARREEIRSEIEEKMKLSMTDTLIEEIKYLIQERNSIMRNFQECLRIKSDIQVNVEENRKYRDSLNKQFEKEFNRGEENEG